MSENEEMMKRGMAKDTITNKTQLLGKDYYCVESSRSNVGDSAQSCTDSMLL